ncbi:4-phosphoerythronate dehydrogenase [Oceanisphaera avium]|uniref:Erythronate-4-phosphate dehydrogenase n=1 Tax=Oceanisphaera avium TaxID=1903694 RepID=A0A1Y0CX85_9GAMM|nr:4-phosphoerythronate dehydrogenase [Oceanisphaera avium]ART79445.1 4-phosphoerythronate dehydrogenase [Oceanisphaera avium]
MKILADENMPYVHDLFGDWAEIVTCPGREMTPEQLIDIDVLLVRSITRVDAALLAKANRLRFVGTATIGCDHIDTSLLTERGIAFSRAPGCNKVGVGDYVLAALLKVGEHKQWSLADKTIAVVGVGNTGLQVVARAQALGMRVWRCDPFKAQRDPTAFVELAQALTADIVSFHVPITTQGPYPTWHLLDKAAIDCLHPEQVLINACRGEVWDNKALLARQQRGAPLTLVMDVWENEPQVLAPLVPYTLIATPHIAGYSLEGKARGTYALYEALASHYQLELKHSLAQLLPRADFTQVTVNTALTQSCIARLVGLVYDIEKDDARFRAALTAPDFFDRLRKHYPERRELASLQLIGASIDDTAQTLGFKI